MRAIFARLTAEPQPRRLRRGGVRAFGDRKGRTMVSATGVERDAGAPVLPRAAARPAGFVGRLRELEALRAQLGEAVAGTGGFAMLVGEPGIGKTRTAQRFAAEARSGGALV